MVLKQFRTRANSHTMTSQEFGKHETASHASGVEASQYQQHGHCDILLNKFEIKKKRYKVLFNNEHVVWERLKSGIDRVEISENANRKATEFESEQLSNKAIYGEISNVMHIDNIIQIIKGVSKSATLQPMQHNSPDVVPVNGSNMLPNATTCPQPNEQYLSIHYAERIVKSEWDCNRWQVRTLTLHNSDAYVIRQWHAQLTKRLSESKRLRVRRLLVFINPYGGRKQGLQTYERYCKPLFQLAGIDASCIVSQRANQIYDMLLRNDLSNIDAVCCVGGDGTVAEVINGLIERSMSDLKLNLKRPEYIPKPSLPVAIIPAGSTDTVAYSLHGTSDVKTAALHLVLGQLRGLDVCSVWNREGVLKYCASVLSYGYLGDVAAKSEKYRWMGTMRYEFTGVKAFLLNRGYEAEIRLLEASDDENNTNESSEINLQQSAQIDSVCYVNCAKCQLAPTTPEMQSINSNDKPCSSNSSISETQLATQQQSEVPAQHDETDKASMSNLNFECDMREKPSMDQKTEPIMSPSVSFSSNLQENTNSKWRTVRGKFFMISGANISCSCSRSPFGIARHSHLGDGQLDLILVRKTSMLNNIRFLINTMGRKGDIRKLSFVETYRTGKFNMRTPFGVADFEDYDYRGSTQPITTSNNEPGRDKVSSWNCDGEVVTDLNITMRSHCQLLSVFMRGPHAYQKTVKKPSIWRKVFCL